MSNHDSRRKFIFLSSGVVAGNLLVSQAACARPLQPAAFKVQPAKSALLSGQPLKLPFVSIPGFLSADQLTPHHQAHYGGAVRGYVAADRRLEEAIGSGSPLDPAAHHSLKRAVGSKGNSILLHELYFEGMGVPSGPPPEDLKRDIANRFGSVDKWRLDFQASANAAKGWAVLMRHPVNGKLFNGICDQHADGSMWTAAPLIVLDTYEHAFYVDYKNKKSEYVERFVDHINWKTTLERLRRT